MKNICCLHLWEMYLKRTEHIAGLRYGFGFSAPTIWPRLYPLVSENLKNILDDQRSQLDIGVSFCAVFVIFTIISFIYYIAIVYTGFFKRLST